MYESWLNDLQAVLGTISMLGIAAIISILIVGIRNK